MKVLSFFVAGVVTIVVALCGTSGVARADVNDFVISKYDMKLELGRDSEKRSTLRTAETITAEFPVADQNRGIERAIPSSYDGHSTSLKILSVEDEQGKSLEYSTYDNNDNTVVRIGNKDTYVHGAKTYVLTYEQRDVTRYYENTKKDEFYWDLNGTDWRVPIRQFSAEIAMTSDVQAYYEQHACYEGAAGSGTGCQITQEGETFRVTASSLAPGENVTIALGFREAAFAGYQQPWWERLLGVWVAWLVISVVLSIVLIIWLVIRWYRDKNRTHELGTIVPEYLPPSETSVTASAEVIDSPHAVFAAQLIDFAVRHYLKIYQTKDKTFWTTAEYTLEIVKDISSLRAEEQELLRDIYDGKTSVGEKLEMKSLQSNTKLYTRMQDNPKKLQELVRGEYDLREKRLDIRSWYTRFGWIMLAVAVVTLSPPLLMVAIILFSCGYSLWTLTDKGLDLRRYLDGLKLYIGVAEEDRLKMLQSPEGAQKVGVALGEQPAELVKLYEKVLPYAILFGQEKEWSKQLGGYYEQAGTQPGWYGGSDATAFNAVVLTSALSNFTSAAAYTSASSSSTGGSSGGGSSGGGGGGGGGGGW